ncbi:MAG: zinc metallopeptidase [Defluviitaleaceae bacterium]|nr:zinc metallopeptidase [Defluviitaleaceae bacterium]
MMFDSSLILLLPAILLSFYAQHKVQSTFRKFAQIGSAKGLTGREVAERLLAAQGIRDVDVVAFPGQLSDHYDPRNKTVALSEVVYNETSLSALSVAAHEVGHAIQHNEGYAPLSFRTGLFPVANIGSKLAMPLLIIGIIMSTQVFGIWMLYAGIALFSFATLFQVATLPVEFNASSRALALLEEQRFLDEREIIPARKVLNAAALTYVAAALASLIQLLRFVLIAAGRRD